MAHTTGDVLKSILFERCSLVIVVVVNKLHNTDPKVKRNKEFLVLRLLLSELQ